MLNTRTMAFNVISGVAGEWLPDSYKAEKCGMARTRGYPMDKGRTLFRCCTANCSDYRTLQFVGNRRGRQPPQLYVMGGSHNGGCCLWQHDGCPSRRDGHELDGGTGENSNTEMSALRYHSELLGVRRPVHDIRCRVRYRQPGGKQLGDSVAEYKQV